MTEETMVARLRAFADREGIKLRSWHAVYKEKKDQIFKIEIALVATNPDEKTATALEWRVDRPHRIRALTWLKGRTVEHGAKTLTETFGHKEASNG